MSVPHSLPNTRTPNFSLKISSPVLTGTVPFGTYAEDGADKSRAFFCLRRQRYCDSRRCAWQLCVQGHSYSGCAFRWILHLKTLTAVKHKEMYGTHRMGSRNQKSKLLPELLSILEMATVLFRLFTANGVLCAGSRDRQNHRVSALDA